MKKKTAGIVLYNNKGEFLLQLRSNDSKIPNPNKWSIFGGGMEEGETPEEAIKRELKEEIGFDLKEFKFYKVLDWDLFRDYTFEGKIDIPISQIRKQLTEGQDAKFFTKEEILKTKLAFRYNEFFEEYFKEKKK